MDRCQTVSSPDPAASQEQQPSLNCCCPLLKSDCSILFSDRYATILLLCCCFLCAPSLSKSLFIPCFCGWWCLSIFLAILFSSHSYWPNGRWTDAEQFLHWIWQSLENSSHLSVDAVLFSKLTASSFAVIDKEPFCCCVVGFSVVSLAHSPLPSLAFVAVHDLRFS